MQNCKIVILLSVVVGLRDYHLSGIQSIIVAISDSKVPRKKRQSSDLAPFFTLLY
jgi:hypothetical protein